MSEASHVKDNKKYPSLNYNSSSWTLVSFPAFKFKENDYSFPPQNSFLHQYFHSIPALLFILQFVQFCHFKWEVSNEVKSGRMEQIVELLWHKHEDAIVCVGWAREVAQKSVQKIISWGRNYKIWTIYLDALFPLFTLHC